MTRSPPGKPRHQQVPEVYIGIRYVEEPIRPVPARPAGCDCDDTTYRPSRTRDGFQVDVLWTLPEVADGRDVDLCEGRLAPCPECPESLHVTLACLTLPASEGDPITSEHINNRMCRQKP